MLMRDIADRATLAREVRDYTVDGLELRAGDETDGLTFDGVASVVGTPYTVRDAFGEFEETIKPGAYNRTIKQKDDVRLLVNHDGVPIARTKSKTLELSTTPHLRAHAPRLDPANPTVQEIRSAIDRGDIDQMSVGMRVRDQKWNKDYTERQITEVELFDVSIVTYPASPTTTAALRSIDELLATLTDVELTEDEIRRALTHLETLLPAQQVEELDIFALRDREDRERLERKRLIRPALV